MEWIIVLDEDWGDGEETGSLCLAACGAQQPHNCQNSKIGINHRPQTLLLFYFHCLSVPPLFTSHVFSFILCPCLLLCCLLSSVLLSNTLRCPPPSPSPPIYPLLSLRSVVFCYFFPIHNAQRIQIGDDSYKTSSNQTQPNWLVSATLNLQFYKVLLGRQR